MNLFRAFWKSRYDFFIANFEVDFVLVIYNKWNNKILKVQRPKWKAVNDSGCLDECYIGGNKSGIYCGNLFERTF